MWDRCHRYWKLRRAGFHRQQTELDAATERSFTGLTFPHELSLIDTAKQASVSGQRLRRPADTVLSLTAQYTDLKV